MKKRHGLWIFHYEARKARERYSDLAIRWWIDEEQGKLRRMIDCMYIGYGNRYTWSNADAILVCAKRYMRRFGGVHTVQQWNELVKRIAIRAGYTHHATMKSAEVHYEHRPKSPIFFHASHFGEGRAGRPYAKFRFQDIKERHMSILLAKRKRIEKENEERYAKHRHLIEQVWETKQAVNAINKAIKSAQAAIKERT
jgi:hypothetical protein